MKKLQVSINKIYSIDVKDNFNYQDESQVNEAVEKHLNDNNQKVYNEFFENVKVICSECGVSLNLDEEKEDGMCYQCADGSFLLSKAEKVKSLFKKLI